jgi:small multidrug resistance pump
MNLYLIHFVAIAFEVLGTMLLPASQSFTKGFPSIVLLISYGISFYLLSFLSQKLSLAIIYASWAGMGVFSIALLSYIFYKQTLNWQSISGLSMIVIGVIIVNVYKGQPPY